mgnify:CR=1 FL=1
MCARYTMATAPDELIEEFEATLVADALPARYNITPTTEAPIVVASKEGERRLGLSRFGLIPHWAKDAKIGARLLNARSESAAEKPAFRDAFRKRRCLVIADGFYEWRREGKQKIPHHFHLEGSGEAMKPFAMAGLWAIWDDPGGEKVSSFTILTREAEGVAAEIHDRMPVILQPDTYAAWLDRARTDPDDVAEILAWHRARELTSFEVSQAVNNVRNEGPELIRPV